MPTLGIQLPLVPLLSGPFSTFAFWVLGVTAVLRNIFYKVQSTVIYCRTYYKAVRVGGGGELRTCAARDDEPRPVWMSQLITHLGPVRNPVL